MHHMSMYVYMQNLEHNTSNMFPLFMNHHQREHTKTDTYKHEVKLGLLRKLDYCTVVNLGVFMFCTYLFDVCSP